jgi:hypothetical protein
MSTKKGKTTDHDRTGYEIERFSLVEVRDEPGDDVYVVTRVGLKCGEVSEYDNRDITSRDKYSLADAYAYPGSAPAVEMISLAKAQSEDVDLSDLDEIVSAAKGSYNHSGRRLPEADVKKLEKTPKERLREGSE